MKKVLKWVGIGVSVPVALVLLPALLLYLPPVQQWAAKKVCSYASEKTGMQISVGRVSIDFPLDIGLDDVKVIRPAASLSSHPDTIADIGHVSADVAFWPLLKGRVDIDNLHLERSKVDTDGLIASTRINGHIDNLDASLHGIDLKNNTVEVDKLNLDGGDVSVALNDSVPEDTTESSTPWKIHLGDVALKKTKFALDMPGDGMRLKTDMTNAVAKDVDIDLEKSRYAAAKVDVDGSLDAHMPKGTIPPSLGMGDDISLTDLSLGLDSLAMQSPDIDATVRHCRFKEKSGLEVSDFSGKVHMDDKNLNLKNMHLKTPSSEIAMSLNYPLDGSSDSMGAAAILADGRLDGNIHATLGKKDVVRYLGDMPADFRRQWPDEPLTIDGHVAGSMQNLRLDNVSLHMPSALDATVSGNVMNLGTDNDMKMDLDVKATTRNMAFAKSLLPPDVRKTVNIPYGVTFNGNVKKDGPTLASTFTAGQGRGTLKGNVNIDTDRMAYTARLNAHALPLQNFLPGMGLSPFTGTVNLNGQGTDMMARNTRLNADIKVDRFTYQGYQLDNIRANANVNNGLINATVDSDNPMVKGKFDISGISKSKYLKATIVGDIRDADLKRLGITDMPFDVAACGHFDIVTDLDEYYKVDGQMVDIVLREDSAIYHPDDMTFDIETTKDKTHAVIEGGDFSLNASLTGGYKQLGNQVSALGEQMKQTLENRRFDYDEFRSHLPNASINFRSGNRNFIAHELNRLGYTYKRAAIDLNTSARQGLNGNVAVDSLSVEGFQIDTIRVAMTTDNETIRYSARLQNNKNNPDYTFRALLSGKLNESGTDLDAKIYDNHDKLGIDVGLSAVVENNGLRLSFSDPDPLLGYKTFHAAKHNYVFLGDNHRVSADLKLVADDGTGLQLYSNDENIDAQQDITASLHRFDLEQILSVLPYTPNITGVMDGDFHLVQADDEMSVSTNIAVDNMTYEKSLLGNLSTEFVYMPKADGTHYIDGIFFKDNHQVAALTGSYSSDDNIQATLDLERLPLDMINGFIPQRIVGLRGYGDGQLTLGGTLSKPIVDGEVYLDSSYIYSEPYGVEMRFADDPVRIVGSRLLFENFEMFANNDSPLNIAGSLDFSNLDRMMLDIMMRAENFKIIDAKENPRSEAFGSAYVDFFGTMKGPLQSLQMRGKLDVLGSTDMTYILRDSELSTDTQLDELVKFTNLQDTIVAKVTRPEITGFDMNLSVGIDEGARILCALNAEKSNYIDLLGGGDMRLRYNASDGIALTGRYTLNSGEMKYSLPVIPLKTFNIQSGSYLEFTGDAMNPNLNITATENVKATVNDISGSSRPVDFNCGVKLTQTLNNPGIQFIIEAPGDVNIQDELNTMTIEERGKVAITMLVSGMYLTDGNTSAFSMNSALSTFLQSEINNIAGSAMRSMGLNLGMSVDNSTTSSGAMHTDYNFRFSKRLWNNRLNVIVGGKVSTGSEIEERNNTFFDNVEFEYRLNKNASQYLRVFYDNSTYDWLDGVIGEYGVGFKWTRRLQHFKDIFRFKSEKQALPRIQIEKKDSVDNEPKNEEE